MKTKNFIVSATMLVVLMLFSTFAAAIQLTNPVTHIDAQQSAVDYDTAVLWIDDGGVDGPYGPDLYYAYARRDENANSGIYDIDGNKYTLSSSLAAGKDYEHFYIPQSQYPFMIADVFENSNINYPWYDRSLPVIDPVFNPLNEGAVQVGPPGVFGSTVNLRSSPQIDWNEPFTGSVLSDDNLKTVLTMNPLILTTEAAPMVASNPVPVIFDGTGNPQSGIEILTAFVRTVTDTYPFAGYEHYLDCAGQGPFETLVTDVVHTWGDSTYGNPEILYPGSKVALALSAQYTYADGDPTNELAPIYNPWRDAVLGFDIPVAPMPFDVAPETYIETLRLESVEDTPQGTVAHFSYDPLMTDAVMMPAGFTGEGFVPRVTSGACILGQCFEIETIGLSPPSILIQWYDGESLNPSAHAGGPKSLNVNGNDVSCASPWNSVEGTDLSIADAYNRNVCVELKGTGEDVLGMYAEIEVHVYLGENSFGNMGGIGYAIPQIVADESGGLAKLVFDYVTPIVEDTTGDGSGTNLIFLNCPSAYIAGPNFGWPMGNSLLISNEQVVLPNALPQIAETLTSFDPTSGVFTPTVPDWITTFEDISTPATIYLVANGWYNQYHFDLLNNNLNSAGFNQPGNELGLANFDVGQHSDGTTSRGMVRLYADPYSSFQAASDGTPLYDFVLKQQEYSDIMAADDIFPEVRDVIYYYEPTDVQTVMGGVDFTLSTGTAADFIVDAMGAPSYPATTPLVLLTDSDILPERYLGESLTFLFSPMRVGTDNIYDQGVFYPLYASGDYHLDGSFVGFVDAAVIDDNTNIAGYPCVTSSLNGGTVGPNGGIIPGVCSVDAMNANQFNGDGDLLKRVALNYNAGQTHPITDQLDWTQNYLVSSNDQVTLDTIDVVMTNFFTTAGDPRNPATANPAMLLPITGGGMGGYAGLDYDLDGELTSADSIAVEFDDTANTLTFSKTMTRIPYSLDDPVFEINNVIPVGPCAFAPGPVVTGAGGTPSVEGYLYSFASNAEEVGPQLVDVEQIQVSGPAVAFNHLLLQEGANCRVNVVASGAGGVTFTVQNVVDLDANSIEWGVIKKYEVPSNGQGAFQGYQVTSHIPLCNADANRYAITNLGYYDGIHSYVDLPCWDTFDSGLGVEQIPAPYFDSIHDTVAGGEFCQDGDCFNMGYYDYSMIDNSPIADAIWINDVAGTETRGVNPVNVFVYNREYDDRVTISDDIQWTITYPGPGTPAPGPTEGYNFQILSWSGALADSYYFQVSVWNNAGTLYAQNLGGSSGYYVNEFPASIPLQGLVTFPTTGDLYLGLTYAGPDMTFGTGDDVVYCGNPTTPGATVCPI